MIHKKTSRLGVVKKSEILMRLLAGENLDESYRRLTAPQMRDLRDFLEAQVVHLSGHGDTPLSKADITQKLEPVPNYYYKQDCREPLEACFNETCLASNPICFSNKMKSQLAVIRDLLMPHLQNESA